jgi:hypothetical protein
MEGINDTKREGRKYLGDTGGTEYKTGF